jgi:hypothetical protein
MLTDDQIAHLQRLASDLPNFKRREFFNTAAAYMAMPIGCDIETAARLAYQYVTQSAAASTRGK